jgi:transcription elongation factor GreB
LLFNGIAAVSKAFTRESDDSPEEIPVPRRPPLPPGVKNLITPGGARRFREELDSLLAEKRAGSAWSASAEQRVGLLTEILQSAEITEPKTGDDRVWFGAQVTVRDSSGTVEEYRIVGMDETDLDRNWISWRSPLARALMSRRVGERVKFQAPGGARELEILAVASGE